MGLYRSIDSPREAVSSLLGKVLGITGLAFLVTALGSFVGQNLSYGVALFFLLANFLVLFGIMAFDCEPAVQLGFFQLFAFIEGVGIGPLMHHYVKKLGPEQVGTAAALTAASMFLMGLVAYLFSIDYNKLSGIGLAGLLGLIGFELINLLFHFAPVSTHVYDWITVAVFTVLTIGDFARIKAGGDGRTATELALEIYLDGLNIFLAILDLMDNRD